MSTNATNNSDKAFLQLKSFANERISVSPTAFDTTEVTIEVDATVLSEYKLELYNSWSQIADMKGFEIKFTQEDLDVYIDQMIYTRVQYTRGKKVMIKPTDGFAVPSYLSLVLSNVGLARNTDLGIELVPCTCKGDSTVESDFCDYDHMVKMSRYIKALGVIGVEYSEGYTRSREGNYDFMSMALIGDYIKNAVPTIHPVYALMASTLGVRGIEIVLSPRVNYGSVKHMTSLVRHLAQPKA